MESTASSGQGTSCDDLVFMKNAQLTHRWSLELRAEAFNVVNNFNFFCPDTIVADAPGSLLGKITTAHDSRSSRSTLCFGPSLS